MPKYTVKTHLTHDEKAYTPGKVVTLDEAQAEPLLAAGVVEPAAEGAPKAESKAEAKK